MPPDARYLASLSQISEPKPPGSALLVPVSSLPIVRSEIMTRPPPALARLEDRKTELMKLLYPLVPTEAVDILFDAGYETVDAVRNLNTDQSDPVNDLSLAEVYTKRILKPGHKKLIAQYASAHKPLAKRTEIVHQGNPSAGLDPALSAPHNKPDPTAALQLLLEKHLCESLTTRKLIPGIDYTISVRHSSFSGPPIGVWRCLVCSSRPVVISLRGHGKYPQLSNVGTHLKTIKHKNALIHRSIPGPRQKDP